ncbi:hypothetical protein [Streptomyces sp. CT34]|uniref:hypothetical protein n=1 Tax=Streptomyces sp. CT34 TaxID=1553907 RepID=UPI0005BD1C71|nr:hypothetical protein [Streptomyces sp. CT34]
MKHAHKNLIARGALAAVSVATIAVSVLTFMDPDSDVRPLITLVLLQTALLTVGRHAGRLGPSSRRDELSA